MTTKSVGIRIGTQGKQQVKNDWAEIKRDGTGAMQAIADGAKRAGDAGEREARRLRANYERAAADIEAAERRRARYADKIAAIAPQTATQMRITDAVGTGYSQPEGSAKQSAAVFRELIAAEEQLEQRTRALMAVIDPAWAAQQRFNAEVGEAKTLLDAGRISVDQYALAEARAKGALDEATLAHGRNLAMSGASRAGMQQLTMQIGDMATMYSLGAKPQQIFASQLGQVIQAVSLMSGGTSKFATFMMGPWGAALTAGTLILTPFVAGLLDSSDAAKEAEEAGKALADRQLNIANFFDLATGKIKENSRALIENARLKNLDRVRELEDQQRQRVASIGQIVKGSVRRVPTGFEETIDPTTGNVMRNTVYSAPNSDLVRAISGAGGDTNKMVAAVSALARSNSPAAADAAKISDIFAQSVQSARDLARLSQEDQSLATGKLVSDLLDPPSTRSKKDRAAGTSRSAGADKETEAARETKARLEAIRSIGSELDNQTAIAAMQLKLVGETDEARSRELAVLRLKQDLLRQNIGAETEEGKALLAKQKVLLDTQDAETRARQLSAIAKAQQTEREGLEARLALIGKSVLEQDRFNAHLRVSQEMAEKFGNDVSKWPEGVLQTADAMVIMGHRVAEMERDWQEVTQIGENFIDTVLSPRNWSDWGDMGKQVLNDLMNEMMRLAVINPLKNSLFGSGLPVLGSVMKAFQGLGGGDSLEANFDAVFGNASGTERWKGGLTRVGEFGQELIYLPEGSKVTAAHHTRRMLDGGGGAVNVPITINIDATGADPAMLSRVEMQVARIERTMPENVARIVNEGRSRRLIL